MLALGLELDISEVKLLVHAYTHTRIVVGILGCRNSAF